VIEDLFNCPLEEFFRKPNESLINNVFILRILLETLEMFLDDTDT